MSKPLVLPAMLVFYAAVWLFGRGAEPFDVRQLGHETDVPRQTAVANHDSASISLFGGGGVTGGCSWTQVVIRLFPEPFVGAMPKPMSDGALLGTHERAVELDRDGSDDAPGHRVYPWSFSSRPCQRVVGKHRCEGFARRER